MTAMRWCAILVAVMLIAAVGGYAGAYFAIHSATPLLEKAAASGMSAQHREMVEGIAKDLRAQTTEVVQSEKAAASAVSAQHREMIEGIAKDLREQTAVAVRDRFATDAAVADRAFDLASQASVVGNSELAKVYLLNALQHYPGHARALAAYVERATSGNADSADAARAQEILTVAAYAVPPEQVVSVLTLAQRVEKRLGDLEIAAQPKPRDLAGEFRSATSGSPETAWTTPSACNARLATLTELRSAAAQQLPATDSTRAAIEVEHDRWSVTQSASGLLQQMKDCMGNFDAAEPDSEMAISALRAAEAYQHALRSLPVASLPTSLVEAEKAVVRALEAGLKRANEARSALPLKRIEELRDSARVVESDPTLATIQVRADRIGRATAEAGRVRGLITDETAAAAAGKAMDEMVVIGQRLRSKQHAAYQIEVLQRIRKAWTRYRADRITTEANALEPIFKPEHGLLIEIDQRLLDPEVEQQLREIWGKLWAELDEGPKDGKAQVREAEIQLREGTCAKVPNGRKLRLEDF